MTRDPSSGEVYELPKRPTSNREREVAADALQRMRNVLAGREPDDDGPEAA